MPLPATTTEIDDPDDLDEVLAKMATFAETGSGWVNIQPEIPPQQQPPQPSGLTQLFRRNSPDAALGTWTPPDPSQPAAFQHVGIQHRLGTRLIPLLEEMDVGRPDGWRRVQDSPRRGLVMAAPHDESHETILRWLLRLTRAASTVQSTAPWSVTMHEGRSR